jgi:hypothetical protein
MYSIKARINHVAIKGFISTRLRFELCDPWQFGKLIAFLALKVKHDTRVYLELPHDA